MKQQNSSPEVLPGFGTFDAIIKDDKYTSYSRDHPRNTECPNIGLREPYSKSTVNEVLKEPKCRLRMQLPNDCQESKKYYGKPGKIKEVKCNISMVIKMCRVVRMDGMTTFDVICDTGPCEGKTLHLGLLGNQTGVVDNWTVIPDVRHLGYYLRNHASSSKFGGSFALLKCEGTHNFQVLKLPKVLERFKKTSENKNKKINFNIIVEDSVSRPHVYRTLLKSVSMMKKIISNQSIPASVLEFEKMQSYGSTTKINLKRLFSGTKNMHDIDKNIGVEDFFSQIKTFGYNTLFQEDNCWYDRWGTLLDPLYRNDEVKDQKTRNKIWNEFAQQRSDCIDDFGVSFLTCSAYAYLHTTNVFSSERFPNVCFAGKHYSSYLLNYAQEYAKLNDDASKPFLAYTHVVTSHENSGRRIVNDDVTLSKLLEEAAYLHNTITIFTSDHGGKSTKFSSYTTQGRQEVFQPFLFVVIPHEVSHRLGPEIMNALAVNQKRLVGLQDLGDALLSYIEPSLPALRGLFSPISPNRTCEQLELDSDVLCLCDRMDNSISNRSRVVKWAADFALGSINNKIQDQFTAGFRSSHASGITSDFYGYGACQRYTGLRVGLARHLVSGEKEIVAFTMFVQPFDRKTLEAFDVKVSFPVERRPGMTLEKFIRLSSFNEYEPCADKNVNPKLCTCRKNSQKNLKWRKRLIKKALSQRSFLLAPRTLTLDKPCLTIISRSRQQLLPNNKRQNVTSTYEAFNACSNVTYILKIDFRKAKDTRVSRKLPDTVKIFPRTVTYLMTILNGWKFGQFVPRFSFKKRRRVRR